MTPTQTKLFIKETHRLFSKVRGVIRDGSGHTAFHIWERYTEEGGWTHPKFTLPKYSGYKNHGGWNHVIGYLNKRPIAVNTQFFEIGGQFLVAIEPCSLLVDHEMIEKWIKFQWPDIPTSDEDNWHNLMPR